MSNVVSTGIFCYRNLGKTENGEIGRAPVFLGQAKNVLNVVKDLDNSVGKGAQSALSVFEAAAKTDKLVNYAWKGVDFASKHINPLICVSGGIKVVTSDDPSRALVEEGCALTAMFQGEGYMKRHMGEVKNSKLVGKNVQKFLKYCNETKGLGKLPAIIRGIAFVCGSCMSYEVGSKIGHGATQLMGYPPKEKA